jgi:site-specific recombinase XerD
MDIEKQAILDEQNKAKREAELAAAREQSRLQAIADTEVRIAREKLVKDQAEQAEKKKLEAGRKFKAWLTTNGVTEDNKSEYKVITENNTSTLYKIISTYQS